MSTIHTFRHKESHKPEATVFRAEIVEQNDRKIYLRLADPLDVHWKPGDEVIFCRKHETLRYADGSPVWT